MFDKLDRSLSRGSEAVARRMTRRQAAYRFARGTGGALAAISVGGLIEASSAYANCPCGPTPNCLSMYGKQCPDGSNSTYCPSGFSRCTHTACSNCIYPDGQWTCGGCGSGCASYYVCTDCKPSGSCTYCTCRSKCFCSGCCTPAEVVADMQQRGLAGVSSGT